ncbi:hypothetical protein NADFUDRAFT_46027 [Nadsonia fulvescens var. elongata DSM 6958]|uniref:Uncharacterized protein n=1 Tax=Nadsonia fulvescens var. elongata DSM 6958 TaxID=857566 RepID=A0A1E3PMT8_9ASCO|nr:hypothetical protein NADFUDRAFT_46027 [Nadsonia fulvescens var. elongata DSM 6958]
MNFINTPHCPLPQSTLSKAQCQLSQFLHTHRAHINRASAQKPTTSCILTISYIALGFTVPFLLPLKSSIENGTHFVKPRADPAVAN